MGIPAHPFAADVRRAVGWPGSLRAGLDRFKPAAGSTRRTSRPSRARAWAAAWPNASSPRSPRGPLGAARTSRRRRRGPGLRDAYAREGSLSRAVAALRAQAPQARRSAASTAACTAWSRSSHWPSRARGPTTQPRRARRPARGPAHPSRGGRPRPRPEVRARLGRAHRRAFRPRDLPGPTAPGDDPAVVDLVSPLAGRTADPVPDPEPGADIRLVTLLLQSPSWTPRRAGAACSWPRGPARGRPATRTTVRAPTTRSRPRP
ncbi:hypothetical protein NKG05_14795 [Oerskovia sp. M15]